MMAIKKITISLILVSVLVFAADPHVNRQLVRNWWSTYDTTGVQWISYDIYHPTTNWLSKASPGSYTTYSGASSALRWTIECGNLPDWQNGDTMLTIGSFDSVYAANPATYGDNINHKGYYWIFSDTINQSQATQSLTPDDTLRPLQKPIIFKRGLGGLSDDTIIIRIPNPRETRRTDQTQYDVLGYLIYADTTGTGTPNAYYNVSKAKRVLFLVAQGVFGDTTTYKILESNFCPPLIEWPVYFAYKIGALPDTTVSTADTSGYVTYYFSRNSDSIHVLHNVVGVNEETGDAALEPQLIVSPNPFTGITKISIARTASNIELNIYDISGKLIKSYGRLSEQQLPFNQVWWNGRDDAGNLVPAGVYFIEATLDQVKITEKIIVER